MCHQGDGVIVPAGPDVSNRGGDQEEPSELGYTDLLLSGSKWNQQVSSSHNSPQIQKTIITAQKKRKLTVFPGCGS